MGFFYKAGGGGGGVTVVEGASFDALATSAKSQDHGVLMLDTSTGFYYKNWKTGGPGIPVPVRYYDDVTAYSSNGGSVRSNAYFTLSDAEADIVTGTSGEDWTVFENASSSITKSADGPATLTATSGSCGLRFFASAPHDKHLVICKIRSQGSTGTGYCVIVPTVNSGGTDYYHYFNLTKSGNDTVKATNSSGSSVISYGDRFSISTPAWVVLVVDAGDANSGFSGQSTTGPEICMAQRSNATTSGPASNQSLNFLVGATSTTLEIDETHILKI